MRRECTGLALKLSVDNNTTKTQVFHTFSYAFFQDFSRHRTLYFHFPGFPGALEP